MRGKHRTGKVISFGAGLLAVGVLAVGIGYFMGNYAMRVVTGPRAVRRTEDAASTLAPKTSPAPVPEPLTGAAKPGSPSDASVLSNPAVGTQPVKPAEPLRVDLNDDQYSPTKETTSAAEVSSHLFKVQVGSYSDREEARKLAARLKDEGYSVYVTTLRPFRVQVGAFEARDRAERLAAEIQSRGFADVQVVR